MRPYGIRLFLLSISFCALVAIAVTPNIDVGNAQLRLRTPIFQDIFPTYHIWGHASIIKDAYVLKATPIKAAIIPHHSTLIIISLLVKSSFPMNIYLCGYIYLFMYTFMYDVPLLSSSSRLM